MDNIEINIIHNPTIAEKDNSFGVNIKINGVDTSLLELTTEQCLHINAIVMNVNNKLLDICKNKIYGDKQTTRRNVGTCS